MTTRAERHGRAPERAAKKPSRAGRNLPAAIGAGVVLGALVVSSLAFRKEWFLPLMVVAVTVGAWELGQALRQAAVRVSLVPVVLGAVSMVVSAYARGGEALLVTFGLTVVGILVWRVADGVRGAMRDIAGSTLVALYPAFLAGFVALMLAEDRGQWWVFFFVLVTVCSDVGGYAFGVLLGRHPMAPSVSPKKSWEGFGGSVLTCAAAGAVALPWALGGQWWAGALTGACTAVAATIGDLMESLLKRDLGIKDMSSIIPGHGGVMDRLDSLVVTAPLIWGALTFFVATGA